VARAAIVLAATTLVVAVVTLVVVVGDHRTTAGATPTGTADVVGAWIRIVLAVLLLATALRLLLTDQHADQPSGTSPADTTTGPLRPLRFFLLGVGAMATNATTLVLLIPAVHTVATAGLRGTQELSLYVTIAFIVLLPAYLPLLALGALGRRGPGALASLNTWLGAHNRTVEIVVSLGFAVFLGWTGFSALT
jgi:hypothetical protein